MRLNWCGTFCVVLGFSVSVFGLSELDQLEIFSSTPNPNENSTCSFPKCEDFKALETKNQKLEEKLNKLQSAQETCDAKVESLSQKFDEFKSEISEDGGVSLMRLPLRGPPGKQGEKADSGLPDPQSIKNCDNAMKSLPFASQRLLIYPYRNTTRVEVLCDFETDGGGWTIIQKRTSGPKEEFQKNWDEYENGFGSLDTNFWLGLENIHALTKNGDQELRIELEDFEGNKKYAKYSSFSVSDASDFYRLNISGFSGTARDSMTNAYFGGSDLNNGMRFSTKDKDNDNSPGFDCVAIFGGGGGWWFSDCGWSSLNGLYFEKGETVPGVDGIWWYSWKGLGYSLAKTEMKIRKRK